MRTFIVALIVFLMGIASAYSVQSETHPTNSSYSAKTFNIGNSAFGFQFTFIYKDGEPIYGRITFWFLGQEYGSSDIFFSEKRGTQPQVEPSQSWLKHKFINGTIQLESLIDANISYVLYNTSGQTLSKGVLARNTNLAIPVNHYKSNLIYMSFFANGKRETVGINLLGSK